MVDAFGVADVLSLSADGMFNNTAELGFGVGLFAVFTPDTYDEGVFCHGIFLLADNGRYTNQNIKPIYAHERIYSI